jgi:hypothetical protein
MNIDIRVLIVNKLKVIPRGGPNQKKCRIVYDQVRLDDLRSRPEIAPTPHAAHEFALRVFWGRQPGFIPELLSWRG